MDNKEQEDCKLSSTESSPAPKDDSQKRKRKAEEIKKKSGSAKKRQSTEHSNEQLILEELKWDTLLPYKNHPDGEKKFNDHLKRRPNDPTPMWFVTTLQNVMKDESLQPPQKDPLGIIEAWEKWESIQPNTYSSKKNLTAEQRRAKDLVGQKFHSYLHLLRCADCVKVPVKVFSHMVCQNGCPPDFEGYNDRPFRDANMLELEAKLSGKHSESWNNMQNLGMHVMVKWSDMELKQLIAADMAEGDWKSLNPKEIGKLVEEWFQKLSSEDLDNRSELIESLIPTAGKDLLVVDVRKIR